MRDFFNLFFNQNIIALGFPGGSVVKNPPAKQEMQETWVQSLGREGPWKEGMATRFSVLVWENPMVR